MKIGSSKYIKRDKKNYLWSQQSQVWERVLLGMDKPIKDHPVAQNGNQKMLPEKHNDEELTITILIVGTGLIAYHF